MRTLTYLNFDGNCREAMTFYSKCLGAQLQAMPFSEGPAEFQKGGKDRIMHSSLTSGTTPLLMASDTMPGMPFQPGNNFSVSVHCESLAEIEKLFTAFSDGGTVTMPLQDTFWGARFGMLKDRYDVHWMFDFEQPKKA